MKAEGLPACGILGSTLQGILGLSDPPVLEVPQEAPEDLELKELREEQERNSSCEREEEPE